MMWYAHKLPKAAEKYSIERLSKFPNNEADLFMMLQICVDESYQFSKNSLNTVVIGGWLSSPENFIGFCPYWKRVLDEYSMEYFHFKEFSDRKSHRYFNKTIYDGMDDLTAEKFLFDLALVACEIGVPIAAGMAQKSPKVSKEKLIFEAHRLFFAGVQQAVTVKFETEDIVDFVFDETDDPLWEKIGSEILKGFKNNGAPFGRRSYDDDKVFFPLQAADIYVYSMRRNMERFYNSKKNQQQPQLLDLILDKNRFDMENWKFHWRNWDKLMRMVIEDYRQWKKTNPNQTYYPLIHCPLLQQNES